MKLAFHLFRKDVRQFGWWLLAWLMWLLIDLAVNLGWVADINVHPMLGYSRSSTWAESIPAAMWMFVGLLPAMAVLTDSPARRDGFLSTRPIRKSELLLGKLLFASLLVIAPWTLSETVHLILRGAPMGIVLHGTVERLLIALPVTLLCGAFASLWSSRAGFIRTVAVLFGAVIVIAFTTEMLKEFFKWRITSFELNVSEQLAGLFCLSMLVLVFAMWHARRWVGWRTRWAGLILCVLISFASAKFPGWHFAELQPENLTTAEAAVRSHPPGVRWNGIAASPVTIDGKRRFSLNLHPELLDLENGCEIRWGSREAKLIGSNGAVVHHNRGQRRERNIFEYSHGHGTRRSEIAAWADLLPEGTIFRFSVANSSVGFGDSPVHVLQMDVPRSESDMAEEYRVNMQMRGNVFQWRKVGELPLKAGAEVKSEHGTWRLAELLRSSSEAGICLEHSVVELISGRDSRISSQEYGAHARTVILIHDPEKNIALVSRAKIHSAATRSTHTAFPRYFLTAYFGRPEFTESELARMRLVLLETVWLGASEVPFESERFALKDKLPLRRSGSVTIGNLKPDELFQRVMALPAPATNASRREVSLYLSDVFRILSAGIHRFQRSHPIYSRLTPYVPQHLDLFLAALPELNGAAGLIALDAIRLGASDEQKNQIIAALPESQQLAEVVLHRGWVEDARDELRLLAQRKGYLAFPTAQCIAFSKDRELYPRLVEAFTQSFNHRYDQLLRNLGLGAEADRIVAGWWKLEKLAIWDQGIVSAPAEKCELALRNGDASALRWIYAMLNDPGTQPLHARPELLGAVCHGIWSDELNLPQLEHGDSEKVTEWLRRHRPEDFTYQPVRRQFVLKTSATSEAQ